MAARRSTPTLIDRVQDRYGRTIFRHDERPCDGCANVDWTGQAPPEIPDTREQVLDPADRLSDGLDAARAWSSAAPAPSSARWASRSPARPAPPTIANDVWFIGFSPDLALGVYIGYDTPRSLGTQATGGAIIAPLFKDFMAEALKDQPVPFRVPPGIRLVRVDLKTGQRAQPATTR